MSNEPHQKVCVEGSQYERRWGLHSGQYLLLVDTRGLVLIDPDSRSRICIARHQIRRLGLRQMRSGQGHCFVEIGRGAAAGAGHVELGHENVAELDVWIRRRITTKQRGNSLVQNESKVLNEAPSGRQQSPSRGEGMRSVLQELDQRQALSRATGARWRANTTTTTAGTGTARTTTTPTRNSTISSTLSKSEIAGASSTTTALRSRPGNPRSALSAFLWAKKKFKSKDDALINEKSTNSKKGGKFSRFTSKFFSKNDKNKEKKIEDDEDLEESCYDEPEYDEENEEDSEYDNKEYGNDNENSNENEKKIETDNNKIIKKEDFPYINTIATTNSKLSSNSKEDTDEYEDEYDYNEEDEEVEYVNSVKKWHEKKMASTEYCEDHLVPIKKREEKNCVAVGDTNDVYAIPQKEFT